MTALAVFPVIATCPFVYKNPIVEVNAPKLLSLFSTLTAYNVIPAQLSGRVAVIVKIEHWLVNETDGSAHEKGLPAGVQAALKVKCSRLLPLQRGINNLLPYLRDPL